MKPLEPVQRKLVGRWIEKADEDWRTVKCLLNEEDPLRNIVAFHCQQAAEKYLKAWLTSRNADFPKTHDLKELLALIAPLDADLAAELGAAVILTPFGVSIRYPATTRRCCPGRSGTSSGWLDAYAIGCCRNCRLFSKRGNPPKPGRLPAARARCAPSPC
jgi:HEPN domain-containing protein